MDKVKTFISQIVEEPMSDEALEVLDTMIRYYFALKNNDTKTQQELIDLVSQKTGNTPDQSKDALDAYASLIQLIDEII